MPYSGTECVGMLMIPRRLSDHLRHILSQEYPSCHFLPSSPLLLPRQLPATAAQCLQYPNSPALSSLSPDPAPPPQPPLSSQSPSPHLAPISLSSSPTLLPQ